MGRSRQQARRRRHAASKPFAMRPRVQLAALAATLLGTIIQTTVTVIGPSSPTVIISASPDSISNRPTEMVGPVATTMDARALARARADVVRKVCREIHCPTGLSDSELRSLDPRLNFRPDMA
jgi:hypothetical protein